jgi:hypothetical protein
MHPRSGAGQEGRCLLVSGVLAQPVAIMCALAGAGSYAVATVIQQRAAARHAGPAAVEPGLLLRLVKTKRWLLSLFAVAGGYGLQATALGLGRLIVVEPVFPIGLLFALVLAARIEGRWLRHSEWTAAVAAVAGMAVFLVAAEPSGGQRTARTGLLALAAVGVIVVAGLSWLVATKVIAGHRALTLSIAGGIGAGVLDALTKTVVTLLGRIHVGVLADPRLYLLAVVGLMTLTLQQNSYRAAGLAAALPAFAVLEPVVGSLLGLFVYHERVGTGPVRIVVEALGILAAIWGIARLANSVSAVGTRLVAVAAVPAPGFASPPAAQPVAPPVVPPVGPAA